MQKFLFIVSVFICLYYPVHGQSECIFRFRTFEYSYKIKINNKSWDIQSKWKDTSVVIVLNLNEKKLQIFNQLQENYDILKLYKKEDDISYYSCLENNGNVCTILIGSPKKKFPFWVIGILTDKLYESYRMKEIKQ